MHTYIIGCALKDFHFYEGGANVLIRFPSINTELNDSQNYDIYLHYTIYAVIMEFTNFTGGGTRKPHRLSVGMNGVMILRL